MKTFIAAEGDSLESPVAGRFERAGRYLLVDDMTGTLTSLQHPAAHHHHALLATAASENVDTVVAGKISFGNLQFMASLGMRMAYVHHMSAREAMEKLQRGDLKACVVRERDQRQPPGRRHKAIGIREGFSSGTPRGQHHLQQYGGRGH